MKFIRSSLIKAVVLAVVLLFQACQLSHSRESANVKRESELANYQSSIRYAQGFSISNYKNYKVVSVFNPFVGLPDTLRYLLVPRGTQPPPEFQNAQVIETPVKSMVVTSTTHAAFLDMLNAVEVLEGIGGAAYIYNPEIRKRLESGEIASLSMRALNMEKLVAMNPDVIMVGAGTVSSFNDYRLLMKMGITVFVNGDWLETTPLGRAEWVKAVGALLGKDKRANKKFKKVARHYNALKKRVAKNISEGEKPLVINNLPYKGAWFVPGGDSYMAQYLKDAGADYPWYHNNETGGLKLGFEAVYYQGVKADIWINPGRAKSIARLLAKDSRLADFKSVQTGQVYNKNKRVNAAGGNDYWETGVVRPDLVLHDLINIFHPGLLENDSLYFYQKLR